MDGKGLWTQEHRLWGGYYQISPSEEQDECNTETVASFKNPMGTVKDLPYPHTKQGTDEAKNTDRTPLKMSATVASMDY